FIFAGTPFLFAFVNAVLSIIFGWTQPALLGFFQGRTVLDQQRSMGAARTALVSVAGAFGSSLAAPMAAQGRGDLAFVFAASICLISAIILAFDWEAAVKPKRLQGAAERS